MNYKKYQHQQLQQQQQQCSCLSPRLAAADSHNSRAPTTPTPPAQTRTVKRQHPPRHHHRHPRHHHQHQQQQQQQQQQQLQRQGIFETWDDDDQEGAESTRLIDNLQQALTGDVDDDDVDVLAALDDVDVDDVYLDSLDDDECYQPPRDDDRQTDDEPGQTTAATDDDQRHAADTQTASSIHAEQPESQTDTGAVTEDDALAQEPDPDASDPAPVCAASVPALHDATGEVRVPEVAPAEGIEPETGERAELETRPADDDDDDGDVNDSSVQPTQQLDVEDDTGVHPEHQLPVLHIG